MARSTKPLFLTTKGERNAEGDLEIGDSLLQHYRGVAGGLYKWEGLPDDCPADFPETDALFFNPGMSAKRIGRDPVVCGISPATLDIYATPFSWIPSPAYGTSYIPNKWFEESRNPALWLRSSTLHLIQPYLEIMERVLKVLNTNIFALSQPIMIEGLPGAELDGLIMKSKIMNGQSYIPVIKPSPQKAQVLDLQAQDHTQNLISTLDWCDARILEVMASSNGVQKSSGITTAETVSGIQSVMQDAEAGLRARREWCERINAVLGTEFSVDYGEGIRSILTAENGPRTDDNGKEVEEDVPQRIMPIRGTIVSQGRGTRRGTAACEEDDGQDPAHVVLHRGTAGCGVRGGGILIEIDTPNSIIVQGNDYFPQGTDIFEVAMGYSSISIENQDVLKIALWGKFRYYMLGNCDTERWAHAMAARMDLVVPKWDRIVTILAEADPSDINDLTYTRVVKRTAVENTPGTVRTISHSGSDVTVNESEILPQTPNTGQRHVDNKVTGTRTNGQTDTDTYNPNEKDHEEYHQQSDIAAVTYKRLMENWPEWREDFVREFEDLFCNCWSVCRWCTDPQTCMHCRAVCRAGSIPLFPARASPTATVSHTSTM